VARALVRAVSRLIATPAPGKAEPLRGCKW
jgi:hypothetical protein